MAELSDGTLVSTRIRLARNVEGYPFPSHLKDEKQAKEIIRTVSSALSRIDDFNFQLKYMDTISEREADSLKENHLISPGLVERRRTGAALISSDGSVSVMINEEDHLREQCIVKGMRLKKAYDTISDIDSRIGRSIKFSYDEQLGYLTACPTNLGTGLRASVMLFLPALTINGSMREVVRSISRLGLTVRGVYGEGSDAEGYMYQISNEVTLGVTEEEIISEVQSIARKLCDLETAERGKLKKGKKQLAVKDKCLRAYGIATNCAILSSDELTTLAADIKLGACLGYINIKNVNQVDELVIQMQPCNIKERANNDNITPEERDIYRAEQVSARLKKLTGE